VTDEASRPALRVVSGGEPTADELAALVVALTMRPVDARPASTRAAWSDRRQVLRKPLQHGVDAWRWSLR
jgi:hypothetical protein